MNVIRPYLIASTALGTLTGAVHGYSQRGLHVESIVMQGLQGMVLGPYAPLVIPYVLLSSKCSISHKKVGQ